MRTSHTLRNWKRGSGNTVLRKQEQPKPRRKPYIPNTTSQYYSDTTSAHESTQQQRVKDHSSQV